MDSPTPWSLIEQRVQEELGISPEQLKAATDDIQEQVREANGVSFSFFFVGTFNFSSRYLRNKMLNRGGSEHWAKQYIAYFKKNVAYTIPNVLRIEAEKYGLELPMRKRVINGKLREVK